VAIKIHDARPEWSPGAVEAARLQAAPDQLRAFGLRFGEAEGRSLRARLSVEIDLATFGLTDGDGESVLLLDAMFRLSVRAGRVERARLDRLLWAGRRLGIDPALVGALVRRHDQRRTGGLATPLTEDHYVIGSAATCNVRLPDSQVAPAHAQLIGTHDGWRMRDLGSGRPTLIDAITGVRSPTHGVATFDGQRLDAVLAANPSLIADR